MANSIGINVADWAPMPAQYGPPLPKNWNVTWPWVAAGPSGATGPTLPTLPTIPTYTIPGTNITINQPPPTIISTSGATGPTIPTVPSPTIPSVSGPTSPTVPGASGPASPATGATGASGAAGNYSLFVGASPGGTVSLNPPGGSYAPGTLVTVTPTASPGFQFTNWIADDGNIYTQNPLVVNMTNGNHTVAAVFVANTNLPAPTNLKSATLIGYEPTIQGNLAGVLPSDQQAPSVVGYTWPATVASGLNFNATVELNLPHLSKTVGNDPNGFSPFVFGMWTFNAWVDAESVLPTQGGVIPRQRFAGTDAQFARWIESYLSVIPNPSQTINAFWGEGGGYVNAAPLNAADNNYFVQGGQATFLWDWPYQQHYFLPPGNYRVYARIQLGIFNPTEAVNSFDYWGSWKFQLGTLTVV